MSKQHPFRFGLNGIASTSRDEWRTTARKAEDLGYSTLCVGDHLWTQFAPLTSLMAAAEATTHLRVGSFVFGNDFRHPVGLAREAATIDLLSGGRLELGIGTGWERADYQNTGIPLESASIRVSRFEEAISIIKKLFGEEPVTYTGRHYTISNLNALPKPAQRPHPPILIGGGGRRMLSIAAREADIVSVNIQTTSEGSIDVKSFTAAVADQQVEWVRQAAGARFPALELNTLVLAVIVSDDKQAAVEKLVAEWRIDLNEISVAELLESPHLLFGTEDEMVETLQQHRERYGISYFTIFGEQYIDTFAPVLARLVGT